MIFVVAIALAATAWRFAVMFRRLGRSTTLNSLAAGVLAGIVAGLLFGVTARIAMRVVALGMDAPLRFTASGSLAVVIIFSGMGVVLALPYPALFRRDGRGYPLAYACALTLLTLQPFVRAAAQDLGASSWDVRVIIGATLMTLILWFPYAVVLEGAFARIERRLQGSRTLPAPAI